MTALVELKNGRRAVVMVHHGEPPLYWDHVTGMWVPVCTPNCEE
jgi:hypothetical protein